jgi:ABC-type Fe3+ transport system permease subunit
MASDKRPAPTRRTGGRVTPKGGPTKSSGTRTPAPSTRYTPPVPKSAKTSPRWLPVVILALIALGVLVIFFHYVAMVVPGASSNWWLLGGLMFILGGIVAATQYR